MRPAPRVTARLVWHTSLTLAPPDFGLVAGTHNLSTFNVQPSYAHPVSSASSRVYSMKLGHEISGGTPWSQLGM